MNFSFTFSTILILAIFSCGKHEHVHDIENHHHDEIPVDHGSNEVLPSKTFCQVEKVFENNCIGCHYAGGNMPNLSKGFSYNSLVGDHGHGDHFYIKAFDPDNSPLFKRLITSDINQRMPRGKDPLSDSAIELVRQWINEGASTKCEEGTS